MDPKILTEEQKKAAQKLKTARGQIDGVIKMIEDGRYCVDISTQILAVIGLLKKANTDILSGHLRSCVKDAILHGGQEEEDKINEIVMILDKYIK